MSRFAWIAAITAVVLAACGGKSDQPDATPPAPDAMQPPTGTLTAYVIDLVVNHSAEPAARPFAEFATLPDPDQDNPGAYAALFP